MGAPCARTYASAASSSVNEPYAAVGMPARSMSSLENFFEPSICAPAAPGPKQGMPAARTASATPATSGASGPTTTRPTPAPRAKSATACGSSSAIATFSPTWAVPPLPGAM